MADRGRGGYRRPSRPAAVSPPQSGLRTDGGPADKQAIRTPTGGAYGATQAAEAQQGGAPMVSGAPPGAVGGVPAAGGMAGMPQMDTFGPTQRPNESGALGAMGGPSDYPDSRMVLQEIHRRYPSPWIASLLG